MDTHDLIVRLNRIEGQISAIKQSLVHADRSDCSKTLYQVKAAANALKRFGEAFTRAYAKDCVAHGDRKTLERRLDDIISSAFTLS